MTLSLSWRRFAIVGTTNSKHPQQQQPQLLSASSMDLHDADKQCQRYALQGWGCQVLPVEIRAMPPQIEKVGQ